MAKLYMGTGGKALAAGPREPASWPVLRRLAGYLPPLWAKLAAAAFCTIIVSLSGIAIGGAAKFFLDGIKRASATHSMAELDRYTLLAIALFLVKGAFNYGQQYFMASATQRLAMRLGDQVFAHLQRQSMAFFDTRKTGQLMAAITADVPAIQNSFTAAVLDSVASPVTILVGVAALFWLNWRLATLSLVCLPATAWLITSASRRMRRHTARLQSSLAEVSEIAEETLSGHRAVQAFGNEQFEIRRFQEKSRAVLRSIMRTVRVRAGLGPSVEILGSVAMLLVLWFGGRDIVRGAGAFTVG